MAKKENKYYGLQVVSVFALIVGLAVGGNELFNLCFPSIKTQKTKTEMEKSVAAKDSLDAQKSCFVDSLKFRQR